MNPTPTDNGGGPTNNEQSSAVRPLHVTVLLIPIVGASGTIQSRSLVFHDRPTKEVAISTILDIHKQSVERHDYHGEWERCAHTLQDVPEELFARMNQRRVRKITHMVPIKLPDGSVQQRLFSGRSCFVHGWDREKLNRYL